MSARVSVIIPAFNAATTIRDAINSVLAQSNVTDTEIIVIDDGSIDDTKAIVSELRSHHQQIIYVLNERKQGPSGARNTGILRAGGEYIAFLDADDLWFPNHLEEGINFLGRNNEVDVVFFNFDMVEFYTKRRIGDWFSERNFSRILKMEELEGHYFLIRDDMFNALLDESFMHLQSMIIRKKVLKGVIFNEDIKRSEDRDFSIKLFANSKARFAFKNIITGIYFRHENSLTSNTIENSLSTVSDHIYLYTGYLSNYTLDAYKVSKLKRMLFEKHMAASYYYRKLNHHWQAIMSLFKSFKYNISVFQIIEFAKVIASFVNSNIFLRTRLPL